MRSATALALAACLAPAASAQVIQDTIEQPTLDRWMYPFNGTPGSKLEIVTFGATNIDGFDDMDAQMIVGFDTTELVEAGLGADSYRVLAVTLHTTNAEGIEFAYDPTYDAYQTYLLPENPEYLPDEDAGRPNLLYAVGYRGGFDLATFEEDSTFGDIPPDFDTEGVRTAFAALFDDEGAAFDVSRHVREGFEAPPLGVGQADGLEPGELVGPNTPFAFNADLCVPGFRAHVAESLDFGRLNLAVASMHSAEMGEPGAFPRWYSKENPLALPPFDRTAMLTLEVFVGDLGDFDGNGVKNILDFVAFQEAFIAGDPLADVNQDCELDILDFVAFQTLFTNG